MVTDSSDYGFSNEGRRPARPCAATFSYPMFRQFVADNRTMDDLFACAPYGRVERRRRRPGGDRDRVHLDRQLLPRARPRRANPGRTIVPEDDRPTRAAGGGDQRALLAHAVRRRSARSIGKVVQVNNVPVTIVGVISPEFIGVQQAVREAPDIAVPLALDAAARRPPQPGEPRRRG